VEVFCKYILTNASEESPITTTPEGYRINIIQLPDDYDPPKDISDEEWRKMSPKQNNQWYEERQQPSCGDNLTEEGGGYLGFTQYNKLKKNGKIIDIVHYVEIGKIESLSDSLTL